MRKTSGTVIKKCLQFLLILCMAAFLPFGQSYAASSIPIRIADTSVRLLEETLKLADDGQNVLISPDSVLTAVMMAENGAAGSTLPEMETAFGNISVKDYTLYLKKLHQRLKGSSAYTYIPSNSVWYKKNDINLKKQFIQKMKKDFKAQVIGEAFDSGTVNKMNAWVNKHTKGMIPSIIDRLQPDDRVILLNTVFFKGTWEDPYDTTYKRSFTSADGRSRKVDMLEGSEKAYMKIKGAKGFVKPYEGGNIAFLALLPPKSTAISSYVKKLTGADLINGYKNRKKTDIIVRTRMPEFNYKYELSLKTPLKQMGIKNAFSETKADFSKMSDQDIHIDDIIHKTHISLTKDGTEAAAVTAVMIKANSILPSQGMTIKTVYLNRPFVYAIIDMKTGIPLFLGVVNQVQ